MTAPKPASFSLVKKNSSGAVNTSRSSFARRSVAEVGQREQQVERPVPAAPLRLLRRDQSGGQGEGLEQEEVDRLGEGEADQKRDRQRGDADDQPAAQLGQVSQQWRARGFELGVFIKNAHVRRSGSASDTGAKGSSGSGSGSYS
jgi:hypothetical protein